MVDWDDLAERCAKATGPDSGLDVDITRAVWDLVDCQFGNITHSKDDISYYIERVLPGWAYKMGTCCVSDDAWLCPDLNDSVHGPRLMQQFGPVEKGSIWDEGFDIDRRPSGNMALAMCEAFCRAMAAVAEKDATK